MHSGCAFHVTPATSKILSIQKCGQLRPARQTIQVWEVPSTAGRQPEAASNGRSVIRGSLQRREAVAAMGDHLTDEVEILPQEFSQETLDEIVQEALVWATLHGAVVGDKANSRSATSPGVGLVHVPLSLLPTAFPREAFAQALELATHYNTLVDNVSQDTSFLREALAQTRRADPFTGRLMDIYDTVLAEGISQEVQLGLHRSDYMLDMVTGDLLQVEMNTISSSFASLGALTSKLHKYIVNRFGASLGLSPENIPENTAMEDFAQGLGQAWLEFNDPNAAVLMIVHATESNMYDQQWLSFKLYESFGAKVIRRTFAEVHAQGKLDHNRRLMIDNQPVGVVYYRSGYSPDDYITDSDWDARLLMERSTAIKCPSIAYHLVGAKKIQQELAKPGVLERFLHEKEAIAKVRASFAGLWSLNDDASTDALKEAVAKPEGFVLKPQREGGGNNIYGKDVARTIEKLKQEELAAYILMQRIFPAENSSYLIRDGVWRTAKTVSELGVFSTYLRNGKREILNKQAGHLVRSKVADSDEGGVAAGYGVLDSPYLT